MVNVVTTEVLIIAIYLACLLFINSHYQLIITLLLVVALTFPIAFYHHSWSVWLAFDHLVETLPKYVEGDRARAKGERGTRR